MRQNFRPYSMVIAASNPTTTTPVILKDSAKNDLLCNYISVSVSGASPFNREIQRISIDPPGLTTPHANSRSFDDSIVDPDGSALPCVVTSIQDAPAVLVLPDSDRVSKIFIQSHTGTTGTNPLNYIITYGQVSVGNNIRDNERPKGK